MTHADSRATRLKIEPHSAFWIEECMQYRRIRLINFLCQKFTATLPSLSVLMTMAIGQTKKCNFPNRDADSIKK